MEIALWLQCFLVAAACFWSGFAIRDYEHNAMHLLLNVITITTTILGALLFFAHVLFGALGVVRA